MAVAAKKPQYGNETLKQAERNAWDEYLEATRGYPLDRYCELEPWAWSRLNRRLLAIHQDRGRVNEEDGA